MNYAIQYQRLIRRALFSGVTGGHTERHHIKPRCLGGGNEPTNIVRLSAREHFVAHALLCRMYRGNTKLASAAWLMVNTRTGVRVSSRSYEAIRILQSAAVTKLRTGTHQTAETRAKIAAAMRGKKQTPEHRAAGAAGQRGRKASEETRARMRAAKMTPEAR